MSYEFQSALFPTRAALCAAIAGEWLSAGGANQRLDIEQALGDFTDDALTRECVEAWGLSAEWMNERGINGDDIKTAFSAVRNDPAAAFGWDE